MLHLELVIIEILNLSQSSLFTLSSTNYSISFIEFHDEAFLGFYSLIKKLKEFSPLSIDLKFHMRKLLLQLSQLFL